MDMKARITSIGSILVGLAVMIIAPAWAADSKAAPAPTVSLPQAVHFMDAKGQDLVVGPGEFRVEAAGKSGLKLTPADGKEPIIIEGQVGSVKAPVALSVPVNENEHHLVLLLPKGHVVEVVGSPSGIRSREIFGKRSEVKDSHDRYANTEVNYLIVKPAPNKASRTPNRFKWSRDNSSVVSPK